MMDLKSGLANLMRISESVVFAANLFQGYHSKKIAHAIQDALGNKLLFCYEECDTCNHDLAMVEDQFRILMDFRHLLPVDDMHYMKIYDR